MIVSVETETHTHTHIFLVLTVLSETGTKNGGIQYSRNGFEIRT